MSNNRFCVCGAVKISIDKNSEGCWGCGKFREQKPEADASRICGGSLAVLVRASGNAQGVRR